MDILNTLKKIRWKLDDLATEENDSRVEAVLIQLDQIINYIKKANPIAVLIPQYLACDGSPLYTACQIDSENAKRYDAVPVFVHPLVKEETELTDEEIIKIYYEIRVIDPFIPYSDLLAFTRDLIKKSRKKSNG